MTTAPLLHAPARRLRAPTVWAEPQTPVLPEGPTRSFTPARISVDVRDRRIRLVLSGTFAAGTSMFVPSALAPLHRVGVTPLCGALTLDLTGVSYLDHAALTALGEGTLRLARDGWDVTVLPPRGVPDRAELAASGGAAGPAA